MIGRYFKVFLVAMTITYTGSAQENEEQSKELKEILEYTVKKYQIPGIVAGVANENGIEFYEAAGLRKYDDFVPFHKDDKIHLGSCTKAITSILISKLVAKKKIKWKTTLLETFPKLKDVIHKDYYNVTIHDLMTHTARIKSDATDWTYKKNIKEKDIDLYYNATQTTSIFTAKGRDYSKENALSARRYWIMQENLKHASVIDKGKFNYSNLGYVTAAVMIEKITESSWEELIKKYIFEPLDMKSAGFSYPNTDGKVDQPYGHKMIDNRWVSIEGDKDQTVAPASSIHCNLQDWSKLLTLFLAKNTNYEFLTKDEIKFLSNAKGHYACGWDVKYRFWAYGNTLSHHGSNTLWLTTAWIAPKINKVFLVSTNSFNSESNKIVKKVLGQLLELSIENLEEKRERHRKEQLKKKLEEQKKKQKKHKN